MELYAKIKSGIVDNIIILNDGEDITPHELGFDFVKRIDDVIDNKGNPIVKGCLYTDPDIWSAPNIAAPDYQKIYEDKIQRCKDGFNKLSNTYAAQNVLAGITQAGKTKLIADTLSDIMRYGQTGSLYQVIASLQAITPTDDMAPFLTQNKINSMISDIQTLLGSL